MAEQDSVSDQAQAGTTDQTNTDTTAAQDAAEEFDKERALATIRKLREAEKAGKQAQKELETLRATQKAAEDAKLSESEKLTNRLAELERTVTQQKADAESRVAEAEAKRFELEAELATERRANKVAKLAAELGAHDPHDANVLAATAKVDLADAKAEEKLKAALEDLRKAKPYLFKAAGGSVAAFAPGTAGGRTESDAQIAQRLRHQVQGGKSVFG